MYKPNEKLNGIDPTLKVRAEMNSEKTMTDLYMWIELYQEIFQECEQSYIKRWVDGKFEKIYIKNSFWFSYLSVEANIYLIFYV